MEPESSSARTADRPLRDRPRGRDRKRRRALAAPPAISPDGKHIVLAARRGDHSQLYLRPIDRMGAAPISGTEGALHPFFSPDGQWVAFVAGSKLKKVALSGGLPVVLFNAIENPRGTWRTSRISTCISHFASTA